jgi:hypothetical protein
LEILIAGMMKEFDEIDVDMDPKFTPDKPQEPTTEPPLLGVMVPVIEVVFPGQID